MRAEQSTWGRRYWLVMLLLVWAKKAKPKVLVFLAFTIGVRGGGQGSKMGFVALEE